MNGVGHRTEVGSLAIFALLFFACDLRAADPSQVPTTLPGTRPAVPLEELDFDAAQHPGGDLWGYRKQLAEKGISIESNLIVDDSKNFMGGVDTEKNSIRERFNFGVRLDTEKLLGWHGGTFFAVYQLQHGGNASHELTGDAQNFSFGTDSDGRSQLGQLWYEQKFLNDTFRLRGGKMDGNTDFDVLDNAQDFVNNSFSTSPTLGLMPSFPDTGMGIQLFFEPRGDFYAGAGVFDGSIARGTKLGEYGPAHFLDRADNLFLIAEIGKRYELKVKGRRLPGKISLGGWWSTDPFPRLDGAGTQSGTGGIYLTLDQLLWKPRHERPVSAGPRAENLAAPEEEEYPGGSAASFSAAWCDPTVNRIDGNVLAGLTWTGAVPSRPIDSLGVGATLAHFSDDANTRDPYELAIETFYRVRFTQWISLKPDLQYIIHPNGSGDVGDPIRRDALVFTLRMEMSF